MTDNKRIIALSNQLREEGMQVSIRSTKTACDVWNLLKGTTSLTNLQTALKSVYIKDHHDNQKFDKVFNDLFIDVDDAKGQVLEDMPYNAKNDDKSVEYEDIMSLPDNTIESSQPLSLEKMLPPDFNPETLQQKRIHEKDILKTDISHLNSFDERILDLCRKLGDKIANRRSKRRKLKNAKTIDMPKTIRRNLKNGGKLIKLYQSKPPVRKNKHVFLSDVSGSCDWISSWFFSIIYGCQKSFNKIYSYEFDNSIINTTSYLNSESYYETYQNITAQRLRRGMIHGQSDMAKSFKEFLKDAPLNHKTVVIILTDCRDWRGKREEGVLESAQVLKQIVQKSSKVLIFNPENKKRWNTPTSCVKDYQNAGAKVYEIKNLENLANLITNL